jgi:hypothetical protein
MTLFHFLKKQDGEKTTETPPPGLTQTDVNIPENKSKEESGNETKEVHDIPENLFVEYEKQNQKKPMEPNESPQETNDLHTLYRYLEQNLEKKGYEDALMNPDSSYMEEHVRFLQNEFTIMISKVNTYYKSYVRQIDFHIETRKRQEMIEMVDELLTKKASVEDEMKIVESIENDSRNQNGITQNVILSYKKGFKNGFAAITYGTILSKKN